MEMKIRSVFFKPILENKISLLQAYLGKEDEDEKYPELDKEETEINKIWIQIKKSISKELVHNLFSERSKVVLSKVYTEYKDVATWVNQSWIVPLADSPPALTASLAHWKWYTDAKQSIVTIKGAQSGDPHL